MGPALCQAIPIDQENPDAASLKHVIRLLKSGKRVLVFPEGSRTPDGKIHDGMGGIGLILSKTKVPVQPLRISGAYEAFPIGARFPRLRPVTVTVGDPIPFTPTELNAKGKDAYQHLTDKIMDAIRSLLRNNPLSRPHDLQAEINGLPLLRKLLLADSAAGAIILGNNARGKTSLLEAVCFLLRLQSRAQPGPGLWSPTENNPSASAENFRGKSGASCGRRTPGPPRQRRALQRPAQLPGGQLSRGMDGE